MFPYFVEGLNKGASKTEFEELQAAFPAQLPQSLMALYMENNGQDRSTIGVLFGQQLLPIQEIIGHYKTWLDIIDQGLDGLEDDMSSVPEHAVKENYAHPNWLPLTHDQSGNHIGLDFAPNANGVMGQVINFGRDENEKHVLATSLDDFLMKMSTLLDRADVMHDKNMFSIHDLHLIDALKKIDSLPEIMPAKDTQLISIWCVHVTLKQLPKNYFSLRNKPTNRLDNLRAKLSVLVDALLFKRRFRRDFDLNQVFYEQLSYASKVQDSDQLFPVKVMMTHPRFRHNHDELMQAFKAKNLTEASALLTVDDHEYIGQKYVNEFVTFIGNFKIEI